MLGFVSDDQIFDFINVVALIGWAALLVTPIAPRTTNAIAGTVMVAILSATYVTLFFAAITANPGGAGAIDFSSLDGVAALFAEREAALIGWTHFLAFDLFVGAWAARTSRLDRIPFIWVVPCLIFTFLAGPLGFLLFLLIRLIVLRQRRRQVAASPPV